MSSFYRWPLGGHNGGTIEPLALRPRDAAAAIGVSLTTLDRLTKAGEIVSITAARVVVKKKGQPAAVGNSRVRLYEVTELKAFLARNRTTAADAGQEVTA